ncbi:ABC transporter permease [Caulobacter sp. 1776]|uniref:ABC transporter permease n=1 Tax=Caulobacter sp. 1776 TaxID=3156420 RepID=UPI00339B1A88
MSRLLKIARREYLAYVRTVGFWLSIVALPLAIAISASAPLLMSKSAQPERLAIVDLTGQALGPAVARSLVEDQSRATARALRSAALSSAGPKAQEAVSKAQARGGEAAGREVLARYNPAAAARFNAPKAKVIVLPAPIEAQTAKTAREAGLVARREVAAKRLDSVLILSGRDDAITMDLWSRNLGAPVLENDLRTAVVDLMRERALTRAGVSPQTLKAADDLKPAFNSLSPKAASGEKVGLRDRLPTFVGLMAGFLLWSMAMTGASILLNSVIEEKSSKILEVLLSSASAPEIMGGKILGVAGLTLTVLGVWALGAAFALVNFAPGLAGDLVAVLLGKGLVFYFGVYLVVGYLMYAALFAGVGAFCESQRDAQTLLGPIMIVMTIPLVFMTQALRSPDAPILGALSWFPPFTPFLMPVRIAGDPPAVQVIGTTVLMIATTAAIIAFSTRAFHVGALATGKVDLRTLLRRIARKEAG